MAILGPGFKEETVKLEDTKQALVRWLMFWGAPARQVAPWADELLDVVVKSAEAKAGLRRELDLSSEVVFRMTWQEAIEGFELQWLIDALAESLAE